MIEALNGRPRDTAVYAALAALLAMIWLVTLAERPLFNPDEGRYAEIPREMLAGGDWVIPHLNGLAYLEKPPLQYWATALCYRLFGINEFSARLYGTLCAFATLACTALGARALYGVGAAWRAAAVLAGMLMFVALGQILTLDMSLTFYMTGSLIAFLRAQLSRRPTPWMLLAWFAAGLGVLTKGVIAAALPAAALILYSLYARDWSTWRRLSVAPGVALFALVVLPWHVLAARRDSDFLQFFFIHEHLARYMTLSADREEPWWFFAAVFLAGSLPFTVSALRVLLTGSRRSSRSEERGEGVFDARLFLWIYLVFIGIFFSLSSSKLMPYILPGMPALALLIAQLPPRARCTDCRVTAWLTLAAGVALGAASLDWTHLIAASARRAYFAPLASPLLRVALLLVATGAFVVVRAWRDSTRAIWFLGTGWALGWLLLLRAAAGLAPVYSGIDLARALIAEEPRSFGPGAVRGSSAAAPLYSVATYDQSLTFYLQHTVSLVAYRGELNYGLQKAPMMELAQSEFLKRWSQPGRGYAVMETALFEDLGARGVAMRLLAQNDKRVLVARP